MTAPDTPCCVLLVEDEAMLAMAIDDILSHVGYRVLIAARVPAAMRLARANGHIDVAVLDVNVAGDEVFPVARQLRKDGVPFLFATGYGERGLPDEFSGCPVLQKPYMPDELIAALKALH